MGGKVLNSKSIKNLKKLANGHFRTVLGLATCYRINRNLSRCKIIFRCFHYVSFCWGLFVCLNLHFEIVFPTWYCQVASDPAPSGVLISSTKGSQVDRMTSQIPPVVKLFSWRKWSNPTKHTLTAAGLLTGVRVFAKLPAHTCLLKRLPAFSFMNQSWCQW